LESFWGEQQATVAFVAVACIIFGVFANLSPTADVPWCAVDDFLLFECPE